MLSQTKYSRPIGILVAKQILQGDMSEAREIAKRQRCWSAAEARAIIRCCEVANDKYGCSVAFEDFIWGSS